MDQTLVDQLREQVALLTEQLDAVKFERDLAREAASELSGIRQQHKEDLQRYDDELVRLRIKADKDALEAYYRGYTDGKKAERNRG